MDHTTYRRWYEASGLEGKLLERMAVRRSAAAADCERPGDLAHIDGAPRVHGEPVWRGKAASGCGIGCTPAGQQATIWGEDTHSAVACLRNGTEAVGGIAQVPPEFGHISPALGIKDDVGRPLGIRPLVQVLAVWAEDLDAVALPVTDKDASIRRHRDAVRQVELSWAAARRAPRALELPAGGKLMDAAVAVPVGY